MKKIVFLFFLLTTNVSFALGNFNAVNIKQIYVREGVVDVYLTSAHSNPTGCTVDTVIRLNANEHLNTNLMYSALLSAHVANRKISGWLGRCDSEGRAVIHAINIEPN